MRTVTNTKLIRRNRKIGQFSSLGALGVLGLGLYLTFARPDQFVYSFACLLGGFLLSQIGIYYGNRWGRSPRPDEIINRSMKGLGREYTVYHYVTPAAHFILGPAGPWVILTYYQGGTILYDGKRWRSKGGGFARSYLRLFGQESMGRPELEADMETRAVARHLARLLPEGAELPEVRAALLFTAPQVELKVEESPIPAMKPEALKDFLRKQAKETPMSPALLDALRRALPQPRKEEE